MDPEESTLPEPDEAPTADELEESSPSGGTGTDAEGDTEAEPGDGGEENDESDEASEADETDEPEDDEGPLTPGDEAREFLLDVLDGFGLVDTDVDVEPQDDHSWKLTIVGPGAEDLVGVQGETLNALQYLTSLVTARRTGEPIRLLLDAGGFREKRRLALVEQALKLADEVIAVGAEAELDPLNPYERRIIHQALSDHPQVVTYSEGEGDGRRIVIAPRTTG